MRIVEVAPAIDVDDALIVEALETLKQAKRTAQGPRPAPPEPDAGVVVI